MRKVFFVFLLLFVVGCNTNINNKDNQIEIDQNNADNDIIKDYDDTLGVGVNTSNFPDPEFIKYIKDNIDIDNNDYLSNDEIEKTKSIVINNNNNIVSLEGIQLFSNLEELECSSCIKLCEMDLTKAYKLKRLCLAKTNICNIDISNNIMLDDIWLFQTNIEHLKIYSDAERISVFAINSENMNLSIDVSNCSYLKSLIKSGEIAYIENDNRYGIITYGIECISDGNYFEIISDNQIYYRNANVNGEEIVLRYGLGDSNIISKQFDNLDSAVDYGLSGNKWFKIITHPYKDGIECTLKDCWTNPESCIYQYEVIVYDEQPF